MRRSLFQRCAVVSTMVVFALSLYWAGELSELGSSSSRRVIAAQYWPVAVGFCFSLVVNLTVVIYGGAKSLYLMETGRRLRHVDQQVHGEGRVHPPLSRALSTQDRETP